jgi:hypothetical protein
MSTPDSTLGTVGGLRRGDQRLIAEATGLSTETVKKTIRGERRNAVVKAAVADLIKNREKFIKAIRSKK